MKKTMDNARLSLSIGIALTTGMFTMLPVVAASPVQDTSATNTSGVNVKNSGAQTIGGQDYKTTDITSTATNNVISWKDFSVAKGEAVRFDGGATSGSNAHNYLNVVTGDATSQINGKIIGGNNVYIVNPNGVIFGESASVNVGNLYVSTQKATEVVAGNMSSTNPASVIGSTAGQADVVNLGKVQANSVTVVGKNVRFSNTSNITSDGSTPLKGVAVTAGGYAHIGYDTTAASKLGYTVNGNTSTSNDFQLINTEDALKQVSSSGNYMLGTDLKLTTSYTNSVIPTFSGQFDGMFHEISGLDVTSSNYVPTGLFGTLSGANIFNLGIVGANVKASQTKLTSIFSSGGVGILSGRAVNGTTIKNVYAENGTFNSGSYNGSLTGYADASTYNTVYASNVSGSKALIGLVYNTSSDGTVTIDTAYNSNTGYVVDTYRGGSNLTVKNIYATAASGVRSGVATTASNVISNAKQTSDYSGLSSSDWLKQDGQFPILQAFLKGTVTVNYNYNHENTTYTAFNKTTSDSTSQADKGSNNGADLKLTYNAAPVQIVDADGKVVSDWTSAVTLSNGLTGAEAISQGLLSKNTYQYNSSVSDPLDANVVGGTSATSATSRALFVTTQHGYKLVGNNVTILPREATITADNLAHVSQEYNGSAELTAATKAALLAGSNGSGIIPGDTTASITTDNLHGYFVGSTADNDDGSAAALNKTIHLWGGANLENATGYSNYILSADSVSFGDTDATGTNITALGDITQKAIGYKTNGTVDKIYDGTATAAVNTKVFVINEADKASTSSTGTDGKTTKTADDVSLDTSGTGTDGKYLDSTDLTTEEHNANEGGTAYAVKYTGIKLTGKDAGNYKLIDASGNTLYRAGLKDYSTGTTTDAGVTGGTIYATGYINRRFIDTSTFTVQGDTSHTKIYDGTSTYNVPTGATFTTNDSNTSQGLVDADKNYITFKMADNATSYFTDDSGNAAVDVDTATKIAYQIGATTSDTTDHPLSNYKIGTTSDSAKALTSSDSYNVFGEGSITPRTLILDLTGKNNINKVYDGDTAVEEGTDTDYTKVGGGYIVYDSSSKKLLADDSTAGTTDGVAWKISAKYDDKNVKRDASGNVIKNQNNVTYTVGLSGDATKLHNYVLQKDTSSTSVAGDETITLGAAGDAVRNTGTITPRTVQLTFDDAYRTYDGTTAFGNSKNRSGGDVTATISNLVNGDTVTVGYDTAQSVYNSANVKDATTVTYGGVTLSGDSAGNYQLGSTAYTGNGTIEKLKITGVNLALADGYTSITKEYDNSDAVEGDVKSYVGNLTATDENGNSLTFTQGSGSTTSDTTYTISTSTAPVYESKNSNNSAKQSVYYSLNVGTSNDNYEFDSSLLSNGLLRTTVNNGSDKTVGVITPRLVQVSASDTPFTKTYDTTLKAFDVKGDSLDASKGIALAHRAGNGTDSATAIYDSDLGNLSVNAAYTDKNANLDKDGQALSGHSLNDKTIQYTFTLSGDSAGNYTLVDTSGKNLNGTLNATGNIKQAPLALTISKATKTYDKDNYVTPAATLTYTPQRGDSVTIGYQTAADSNGKSESATYDDANVGTDKLVTYQLAKSGTDANNYYVTYINYTDKNTSATAATNADKFTVVNLGDISKKTLTSGDVTATFGQITKVYDTTASVAYDHSDWTYQAGSATAADYLTGDGQGLTVDGVKRTLTTDGTSGDYTIAGAVYDSPTVNATKATYTLKLGDWASNYDWSNITNYSNGTLTLTPAATITPKYVVASVKNKTAAGYVSLDKVYNGSAKLVRNSQSDPTGKNLSGNVMLDDIIVLDVSGNVVLDGIIANDEASLDRTNLNSNSAYQSPNVAYDADKKKTAQAVSYAVKLTGNSAGNYVLIDAANADTAALTNGTATGASSLTLTDSGIISPYKLTVTFNDGIDKTYDGKSAVVSQDYETKAADGSTVISFGKAAKGTAAGVNGETVTLDMTKVTGTYGTSAAPADTSQAASVTYSDGTPGYFTANGDVNYNENINTSDAYNKADYKALGFTGLQEALASSSISGGSGTASAGNYTIADSVYYKEAAKKGRITRLTLQDKDITSKFGTITKEYDGTNLVANPTDGFIIYETLTGNNTRLSYNLTSALYDDDWTNVTKGHGVTYTVDGIEQKEFHNFVMPDSVSTRFTGIFQTTGAITPRVIKVTGLNGVTKVYDTSTAVETADRQAGVLYSIDADSARLLEKAGATLSVTGADYDSKNATIAPGEAATNQRHITYTLQLDDNSAGNFTLDAANIDAASGKGADAQSRTYTDAAGDIERTTLTLDSLGRHDKDYDSSSKVTNLTLADLNAAGAFSGWQGNERLTFSDEALKKIQGDYGTGSSDADFAAQSDVHRDSTTNAVIDYNVRYTGLEKALEAMRSTTDENAIANNYTIANTAYFTEAAKTGRIKPLAITADKVHAEWAGPVSREYNTTSKVYNPSAYLTGLHADFDNNLSTALTYTVTNAVYTDSDNYDKEHSAAGDNLGLRYTVELSPNYKTITSGDDQGNVIVGNNYEMTAATAQALTTVTNAASYSSDMSVTQHANSASITPRIINASLTQSTDLVKVYDGNKWADGQTHADGTTATVDYRDRLVISTEKDATGWSDADVLAADAANGTVNSATTVAYDDRNADIGSSETVKNGKGVTFTLSLSGSGAGNYTLDSTGQTVTSSQDYAATGDIRRRKANVELIQPTDLDKDYDGTTNVYGTLTNPDGTRTAVDYRRNVRLAPATGDTGVIAGDDLSVFADSVSAAYASPDVQRTSSGAVTTQDVVYSNIQFGGADGGNYEVSGLSSDGTLTGTGTIRPRTITVEGINAPTKVYDGTTAVTSDYATAANLNIDRSNVLAGDTVNVALTGTPVYESSDANEYENGKAIGTKGKIGVDYQLVWDNKNYELVRVSTADTIDTDATAQSDGTLTKKFVSNTGVITPRTLTLTTSQIEKTYDGTTSVTSPESYVTIGNLVDGQSVADLSRTVNGVFSSADAADSENVSETARTVTYTVSINNTNYQLDSTGARSTTTTGTGLIHRRGLMVVATPASILAGEQAPDFSGYVENWANDSDAAGQSDFTFATLPTVDPNVWGSYPVYGYYKGQTAGNYGKNYTFVQSPANETAFTVQLVDAGRHYHETINPKGQVTPDRTIYDQASKDFSNSGNRDPEATLAYTMQTSAGMKDVNADLDGKAGYDGNIAITGGDVVNLAGGDALDASMAIVDELPENNGVSGLNIDGQPVSDRSAAEIQNQDDEIKKTDSEAEQTTAAASSGPNSQIGLESEGAGVNLSA